VDGFSRKLIEDYRGSLDERGIHYLERVRAGAQRMAMMIDDLLRLSRITRAEMKREEVNMTFMANEIADELRRVEAGHPVEFVVKDGIMAPADRGLIRSVLENLMGNAWKFSRSCPLARVEFGVRHDGRRTVYFVRDNGVGFDIQYANKLFTPFQRLHSQDEFEGTGIGLATARRIIRRHGGDIWAESAVGRGSTFCFTLLPEDVSDE
jgi:light-regulated signal transduction histidine kinase (bacteriophytochrome)